MSSTPSPSPLGGVTVTGGIPTKSQDLVASIVFTIAYAALFPLLLLRLLNPSTRTPVLIRPTVFCILQCASYILRAIISEGHYATGLFIAGQVMLLGGFILICEPASAILQQVMLKPAVASESWETRRRLTLAAKVIRIALIVALAVGIWASTLVGHDSASDKSTMKTLKITNASIVIGAIGLTLLALLFLHTRRILTPLQTFPLSTSCIFILIAAGYKLRVALHPTNQLSQGTKVAFYLLSALPQWLAILPYIMVNIRKQYFEKDPLSNELEEPNTKEDV